MAKCGRCGANGLTLKVDFDGLCATCHNQVKAETAEQISRLTDFFERYKAIPDAEQETARILEAARSDAEALIAQANERVDEMKKEAETAIAQANEYADVTRREAEVAAETIRQKAVEFQNAAEYTSTVVIAELNEKLSRLLKDAANDFHFRARSTIAAQCVKDRKASDRELTRDAVMTNALTPSAFRKMAKQKGFVAFDLETTGLSPRRDKIIEIGAIKYEGGVEIERFHTLVNPGIHIPDEASNVNHITDDMVADAPEINDVLPGFLEFIGEFPLVAHNADFDVSFVENALKKAKYSLTITYGDSLQMCRKAFSELPNHKLGTVAMFCGVPMNNQHRAIGDCEALGHIVNGLIE